MLHKLHTMSYRTHKAGNSEAIGGKDETLFGTTRKNAVTTYAKNHPVQIAKKHHFLTPDTPEDWMPSSKETTSKRGSDKKGSAKWLTPSRGRGSTLALRNIGNIPLEKTLSRTPCAPSHQSRQSGRRLTPSSSQPTKVNSSDSRECKIYEVELQRINSSKKKSTKKSKDVVSTTTYSSKSMSCCSVCGSNACSSDHALFTIKSMSLCHSLTDEDNLDQLSLDDFGDEPQVSQPHNSTLNEEDCHLELKDLIPQDLSAIIEEPEHDEHTELSKKSKMDTEMYKLHNGEAALGVTCGPKCSTPTDPEKIQLLETPNVSPITATEKVCIISTKTKSMDLKRSVCLGLGSNETDEPDITPDAIPNKECTSGTVEPKQKRKLAYSMDIIKGPDCILLDMINNKKRPAKLLFKQDKNSQCHNKPWSRLPVDILLHLS